MHPYSRVLDHELKGCSMLQIRSRRFAMLAVAASFLISGPVSAAEPTAAGLWQKVEDNKPVVWVLVVDHGGMFEGAIAKTFPSADDKPGDDICSKCVDDRKNQPVLGLSFIRGMQQQGLKYENGNILDPRDGKIYKAKMSVSADGRELTVRGFWGISLLGKSETWYRLPDTEMAALDPSVVAKYLPAQAAASAMPAARLPTTGSAKSVAPMKKASNTAAPVR